MAGLGGFLPPVVAELRGDISDFKAKMGEARAETETMASQGASNFDRFAKVGGAALLGLGAVAVATAVVSIDAAEGWEAAHARLETAIKNSGGTWEQWSGSVGAAESKAEKLGFTNATVEDSLTKLVPVTHSQKQATDDLALAEDIARGRKMDLESATQLLVKVETGHVGLLGKLGLATKDSTGATISQQQAIRELTAMYSGDASKYAETFAGKMQVLRAEAEDLAKDIGVTLIPIVETLVGGLADGASWLVQNKDAAIVLGVVVGGPLVAAMAAYIVEQGIIVAGNIAEFWMAAAGAAGEMASGVMVLTGALDIAEVGAIGAVTAIASIFAIGVVAAYGLGTAIDAVFGGDVMGGGSWGQMMDSMAAGEKVGKSWGDGLVEAASKTASPLQTLRNELASVHSQELQQASDMRASGDSSDELAKAYGRYHTAIGAIKDAIAETRAEHEKDLVSAHATAQTYGVEIPHASDLSSAALKQVQGAIKGASGEFLQNDIQASLWADNTGAALQSATKDAQTFSSSIAQSFDKATDPFAHFGDQAAVSESDMESFFVGSNLKAQSWSGELAGVINRIRTELPAGTRDAVTGLVQEMAKAGPDSQPALDAFVQMVDQHGVAWVNDMEQSSADAQKTVTDAYDSMAIDAAIKSAEFATVGKAAFADLQEGGTTHLQALMHSSDSNLTAMAFIAAVKVNETQASVDSLHGKDILINVTDNAAEAVSKVMSTIAQIPDTVIKSVQVWESSGGKAGAHGLVAGAHGLVGLARGGSAGMIVGPNQPVVIGEGLSKEAVVPYDNFGDMVATIKNTGRAGDFMRASMRAAGIPNMAGPDGSSSGDADGITPELVGVGARGGGEVHHHEHTHIHVAGSVVTERQLIDVVQEGLLRNGRQGRGPGLS